MYFVCVHISGHNATGHQPALRILEKKNKVDNLIIGAEILALILAKFSIESWDVLLTKFLKNWMNLGKIYFYTLDLHY